MISNSEAVERLENLKSDLGQQQFSDLWHYEQAVTEIIEWLKPKYPVCGKCGKTIGYINTSVFNYDGTDSDCSLPLTYDKESGFVSFSTTPNWTGYELTDEERKEGICCPYCGKFPFDDSLEIEFHEPVEVMMWDKRERRNDFHE